MVMSLEDPIEMTLPGVVQVQVDQEAGLSFAAGVRAIMRCDPDVVMVGEIRDRETLQLSLQIAASGHLVFTQFHAESAGGALRRMVDLDVDPLLTGDATRAVVAQRLVRRLCPECSVPTSPRENLIEKARALAPGFDWEARSEGFRQPQGCPACAGTGFRGRTMLAEVLVLDAALRAALLRGADRDSLQAMATRVA